MRPFSVTKLRDRGLLTAAVVISLIFLFPVYWIVVSSLKTDSEIFAPNQSLWPAKPTMASYAAQFVERYEISIFVPMRNSISIALGAMAVALVLGIPAAYGLVRFRIPVHEKRLIIFTFLVTQMLPVSLVLTPLFLLYSRAGLLNTLFSPILSCATMGIPFIVIILRPYFLSFPRSIEDSARIDGCSIVGAFLRVVIPVTAPGVLTSASFSFIFSWNDLIYSMTFNSAEAMRPMTAGIYHYMSKYGTEWNRIMAYGVILVSPIVMMFLFLRRYLVSGLTAGAVKN